MLGVAFSISSNSTSERLQSSLASELLLREHGLGLAMAQVAGRRADKLGHFVLHLELTAIHSQKMDLSLPCKISANASTVRVFPVPVGPSSRNTPTGPPSGASPANLLHRLSLANHAAR